MRVSKVSAVIQAVFVALALLTACGSNGADQPKADTGTGKKEIKVFTMYVGDSNAKPVDLFETPIGKKITALTGVKLKVEYLVGSDEETRASVMIASGDYPDFIQPHNQTGKFLEAGAIIPIEGYIEKLSINAKRVYSGQLKKHIQKDGHTYYLSPTRESINRLYADSGFWLPSAVLRDAGWPKVQTFDQYIDIIRNYVKKNPTYNGKPTIGFTALTDSWRIYTMQNAPGQLMGAANEGGVYVDQGDYSAHALVNADFSKKYFLKLNELWNEGLMDKEMFSQNYDQYKAKIIEGRVIGFFDQRWQFEDAIKSMEQQNMFDRIHIAMPVLFDGVKKDAYMFPKVLAIGNGICISKNCKDPEAAFKFLDRMMADDIQKLNNWGIEDSDYTVENGKMIKSAEQLQQLGDDEYSNKQGLGRFWLFPHSSPGENSKFADGNFVDPLDTPEYISFKYKPYEKEVLAAYSIKAFPDLFTPSKESPYGFGWDINIPDGHPAKIADQQIQDLYRKYLPKMIMGAKDSFDASWNEFMDELRLVDVAAFERIRTEEFQYRVKAWKE